MRQSSPDCLAFILATSREKRQYPKSLELQVGGQQTHPDELTQVSDSGECVQPTPQQLQGRRVF
ncbi:addiction module toxin RelE [Yersinia enterocolitica]|nr:addiction module toxin RelE [Yersinia enterocolitica]